MVWGDCGVSWAVWAVRLFVKSKEAEKCLNRVMKIHLAAGPCALSLAASSHCYIWRAEKCGVCLEEISSCNIGFLVDNCKKGPLEIQWGPLSNASLN